MGVSLGFLVYLTSLRLRGSGHGKQLTLQIKWSKNVPEMVLIDRFPPKLSF